MNELKKDINGKLLNGSDLAYVGDAYYELYIRLYLLKRGLTKPNNLHKEAIKYVQASSHNKIIKALYDNLTLDEQEIYKKGRNYNYHHKSKSSKLSEYLASSGFEALVGYLYLTDNLDRLSWLMDESIKIIENEELK